MKLVLNEREILSRALNEGYIGNKPSITIGILVKHYFSIGQNKKQVVSSMDSFMSKNYSGYVFTSWQKLISSITNRVHRKGDFELVHVDNISIYKKELDTIRDIDNMVLERLAFSLLVYAKLCNQINKENNNWVNADLKEVLNDARVFVSSAEGALMVKKLYDIGLVRPSKIVNNSNVKVLFAVSGGDVAIEIRDFRDIIFYYLKYIGENIGNCEVCKRLIRMTSNRQKFCRDCWKEHRNKYQKIWDKTRRIRKSDN